MLFTRSIVGVYILDIRFGEILVLISFLSSLIILSFIFKDSTIFDSKVILLFKLFIVFFFVTSYVTNTDLLRPYAFRTSSYIWTISYLFVGAYLISKKNIKILKSSILFLFLIYLFSSGNYPEFLIDLFYKYSDKFQFIKASDLFLTLIVINILYFKIKGINLRTLIYLVATTGIYLPLMLFNSRGAFISLFLYLFLQIYFSRSFFKNNMKKLFYLIVLLIIFSLISTLYIGNSFELVQVEPEPEVISEAVEGIAKNKIPKREVLGFYICENRLCSKDNTLDWRLDIWGDLVNDMSSKNLIFKGYGFNEIFPVMLDPSAPGRLGRDGLNENVHNYFVNIFGRLGFIGLAISVAFYYRLIKSYYQKNKSLYVLVLLLPVFFNSFFDANMEGVQYPFIFFSFLGYIYFNNLNKGKLKSKIL